VGGWTWDDEPPTPEAERLIANSGRVYDRIGEIVHRVRVDPGSFSVTPELVCEFHRVVTDGDPDPRKSPGVLRLEDVQLGRAVVQRVPPSWREVPSLLREHCIAINNKFLRSTPLHTAAYALWAINWIHPFGDGNGKTARAVMYTILCVGYGRMLPGEPAIPDLISRNPYAYVDALKAAHKSWEHGVLDVLEVEKLLFDLLQQVIPEDEFSAGSEER
jgi:Fic family protein